MITVNGEPLEKKDKQIILDCIAQALQSDDKAMHGTVRLKSRGIEVDFELTIHRAVNEAGEVVYERITIPVELE